MFRLYHKGTRGPSPGTPTLQKPRIDDKIYFYINRKSILELIFRVKMTTTLIFQKIKILFILYTRQYNNCQKNLFFFNQKLTGLGSQKTHSEYQFPLILFPCKYNIYSDNHIIKSLNKWIF